MTSPMTPQVFVAKWRAAALSERASYQQHFLDLCALLGHPTPAEIDPKGTNFTFEAGATKQKGGQGWADVWKKGHFAWEYKGKHANLDKAYQQILQYRESLQNPPLLVVCDIDEIQIHTNFTNTVKQVTRLTLDDLLTPTGMKRLRDVFYAPEAFHVAQTTEQVTREAAEQFAKLASHLRKWEGDSPQAAQRIAHFLIRLLFCLFAEDIGLLPNKLFSRLVETTRKRPPLFQAQLQQLFAAMATGGFFSMEDIPHFNGKLFDDAEVLEMDSDALDILAKVAVLDWSAIEPAILGTLFERSLDPAKRSQLGAHYTSHEDILLIIEPVLMAPLRRAWSEVQDQARELAAQRDAIPATTDRAVQRRRDALTAQIGKLLQDFAAQIAGTRVLDPACGSGNFLYVALKQLLDLEKEVITFSSDLNVGMFTPNVSPEQLRGIELNEYAHELAQITVWIGYIQWLRDNGFGQPSQPILKPLDTIRQMDAILAFDADGKPYEPEWPEADVVVGNPPFLGGKRLRSELGRAYVDSLFHLYRGHVPHEADLVAYWFARAAALIEAHQIQRAGLIATQAIRGGANRTILEHIKAVGNIFMAWADRPWILDGAAVRVSLVGFDDGSESLYQLNGTSMPQINADLSGAIDLTQAQPLQENSGLTFMGTTKVGPFDINDGEAKKLLAAPMNPHGKPNSDVVRPWVNGSDITGRPRGMWIIDFGATMPLDEAALYEAPFTYIEQHVKPDRLHNSRDTYRRHWWLHAEPRPALRKAIALLTRYIVTPRVAKHRLFVWQEQRVIPDSRVYVFAREDDYFFGVLHSRLHEVWSLATSSRHGVGNDPTYNSTTCFETFPFPWAPGQEPQGDPRVIAIAEAAKRLVELRDTWLNPPGASEAELKKRTLTNLYNQRPTWLDNAHKKLDAAVFAAYGWPDTLANEEILERLLALNLARAGAKGEGEAGGARLS